MRGSSIGIAGAMVVPNCTPGDIDYSSLIFLCICDPCSCVFFLAIVGASMLYLEADGLFTSLWFSSA